MGTNCAPLIMLIAVLFLFCYERDFIWCLFLMTIDAFNTISKYLDDTLNIKNIYSDNMVSQIYPSELQLNKAYTSDTKAVFLDLHLSISNDMVSIKIYGKRDDVIGWKISWIELFLFPIFRQSVHTFSNYITYSKCWVSCGLECTCALPIYFV